MPKLGYLTPSKFATIMTEGRNKTSPFYLDGRWPGQSALSYANEIMLDLLGVPRDEISAKALEHGHTYEPMAIERYMMEEMVNIIQPESPIHHPTVEFVCGTPDGLIGDDGMIEIKCPFNPVNHLKNLQSGAQIAQYMYQIQGYLWITGRKWCDFVSFDPRFPVDQQIYIKRILRDDELIDKLHRRILMFWDIIQDRLKTLKR